MAQLWSWRFIYANRPNSPFTMPRYFYILPSSCLAGPAIFPDISAIRSLSLPAASTHQLGKFMAAFGERQTKPVSSNLFEISAPLLSARPCRLPIPVGIVLYLPGGQLTGALIEYVVKHSARHYFTVIAGTLRPLQVLIIRRSRKS